MNWRQQQAVSTSPQCTDIMLKAMVHLSALARLTWSHLDGVWEHGAHSSIVWI